MVKNKLNKFGQKKMLTIGGGVAGCSTMLLSTGSGGGEIGKTKTVESSFIFSSKESSCQQTMGALFSLSMEMENTSSSGWRGELDTR